VCTRAMSIGARHVLRLVTHLPRAQQKIPCIDDYGSCSYDLCDGVINIFGPVCDKWFTDHNIPCHCPFLIQVCCVRLYLSVYVSIRLCTFVSLDRLYCAISVSSKALYACLFKRISVSLSS